MVKTLHQLKHQTQENAKNKLEKIFFLKVINYAVFNKNIQNVKKI